MHVAVHCRLASESKQKCSLRQRKLLQFITLLSPHLLALGKYFQFFFEVLQYSAGTNSPFFQNTNNICAQAQESLKDEARVVGAFPVLARAEQGVCVSSAPETWEHSPSGPRLPPPPAPARRRRWATPSPNPDEHVTRASRDEPVGVLLQSRVNRPAALDAALLRPRLRHAAGGPGQPGRELSAHLR